MELWELNECVREYNRMHSENLNSRTVLAWETANFVGAAFSGNGVLLLCLKGGINDVSCK